MDISDSNIQTLMSYLQQTLSPDISARKPAEKFLETVEVNQNYPVLLLSLVDKAEVDMAIRVAGAIAFKNFIKRNWKVNEDGTDRVHASDRTAVKQLIVGLMLKNPELIQKQLSNAISIIGKEDFPEKWPDLLPELVSKFQSGDFHIINGVLHTAHSLFKRYQYESKSQELWTEIKYVLGIFCAPFTELFETMVNFAGQHADKPDLLKIIFNSLVTISKIFYSLNYQDLPEYFEDNMERWMKPYLQLLSVDNKLLQTQDEDEPGLLEQLRSQICDNVGLYAQKYDEEFQPYLPGFVTSVWNLLITTGMQVKYDSLVSNAIKFLASVADRPHYKELFEQDNVLMGICEKVIVPNMEFRESDEELFEDNPEEYIRRDLEGSDTDTRRRAACDLVKALSKFFEAKMTSIFGQYINTMLQNYRNNPAVNWRNKDAAIYLVTSLAAKGQTAQHGITQTNSLVNLTDFLNVNILPDLQNPNVNEMPVLKADAIKYVMIFRNQLSRDVVKSSIPFLVVLLTSQSQVVHSYAAHAIERILLIKTPQGTASFTAADLQEVAGPLLQNLFNTLNLPGSSENEYVMKAIMRTFSCMQGDVIPYLATLLPQLTQKLVQVSKNPSKPYFNHYLFESLSLSIRIVCKTTPGAVSAFEAALFPVFEDILRNDVQEFLPYVFQVLSLLLEMHDTMVPEQYMALFPFLLVPLLWERPANIHPLVRFLQAFIMKGARQVVETQKLPPLLGVFQKLIASKANDHEGFNLIQTAIEFIPQEAICQYLKEVFRLMFQRLNSSKTVKLVKCTLVFFCLYAAKYGAVSVVEMIDGIQKRMFAMVIERLFIPEVQKVTGAADRKICAVGMTKMLCECPVIFSGEYGNLWSPLLQALVGLFELPEEQAEDAEHFQDIDESGGYQTSYSKLIFAGKQSHDPFGGQIPDARLHLAHSLQRLSAANPAKLGPMISSGLAPEAAKFLQNYLHAANVQLS